MEDNKENAIIRLEGLGKQLQAPGGLVTALEDIDPEIHSGKVLGTIGLSEVGKSTLVRCTNYFKVPISGKMIFEGENLPATKDREKWLAKWSMGMIFQQFSLLAQRDVLQNMYFSPEIAGVAKGETKKRAEGLLYLVGLKDRMKTYPVQPFGGQKRRVVAARVVATDLEVPLCNKATSALDPNITKSILELPKKINKEVGVIVIVITHEMAVIEAICGRVATIDHSRVAKVGKASEIFSDPKSDIGCQLILGDVTTQRTNFKTSRQVRIIFDGKESPELVIANVALVCKVLMNIMHTDTRDIGDEAVGQTIIQLPKDDTDAGRTYDHLKAASVVSEEMQ